MSVSLRWNISVSRMIPGVALRPHENISETVQDIWVMSPRNDMASASVFDQHNQGDTG